MASRSKRPMASRLARARIATTNALADGEIQGLVAQFGYRPERLTEGQSLCSSAEAGLTQAAAQRGAKKMATAHVREALARLRQSCADFSKVARAVFADDPASLSVLGLDHPLPARQPDLLRYARTLFNTAAYTPAMRTALAEHGYDDAKIARERSKVSEFEFALANRVQCAGAAKQARQDQALLLERLDKWVSKFMRIARVALAGKPQLLEKLGTLSRNDKTEAQRQAPAKAAATRQQKRMAQPEVLRPAA